MQFFESKRGILEYCGKDGKDVRWLDRAIKDGRIGTCEGDYYLVSEYVDYLQKENGELEEEMVKWRKRAKELENSEQPNAKNFEDTAEIIKLKDEIARLREENEALRKVGEKFEFNPSELEEARAQWEHYEKLAESRAKLMRAIIHETYVIVKAKLGNKMEDEKEFRDSIIAKAKENINSL